jgi:hypothetical protein
VSGTNANNYKNPGIWYLIGNDQNIPIEYSFLIVLQGNNSSGSGDVLQFAVPVSEYKLYRRRFSLNGGTGWTDWKVLTFS